MKIKLKIFFYTFLFFCALNNITAQSNNNDSLHTDKNHNPDSHKNEIGIANSLVFLTKEKNFCYGLHIHYIRNINNSKFGLGLGFERIFDEHKHNTFGIVATYALIDKLTLNVSPGIMLEDENMKKANFAVHIETAYEFEIKNICIGPIFETAFDSEDIHLSLGLHLGIDF